MRLLVLLFSVGLACASANDRSKNRPASRTDGPDPSLSSIERPSPKVLYSHMLLLQDFMWKMTKAQDDCPGFNISEAEYGPNMASYVDFTVSFSAKQTGKKSEHPCQINTDLVGKLFQPQTTSCFLKLLKKAIKKEVGSGYQDPPYNVRICGMLDAEFNIVCPVPSEKEYTEISKRNVKGARHGAGPNTGTGEFEAKHFRKNFDFTATVYGVNVGSFVNVKYLSSQIKSAINKKLKREYGHAFNCEYDVAVVLRQSIGAPFRREIIYNTTIVNATIKPDGYDFPGDFYTDSNGQPQYFGPLVDVYEGDFVFFNVTNMGNESQTTHFHGIEFRFPFNYDDGVAGFSQGSLVPGQQYTYKFFAEPAGSTWYHGHIAQTLASGNKGAMIIRPRSCNNPYVNWYDEDILIGLTSGTPWFVKWKDDDFRQGVEYALRHATGVEDGKNFLDTNPSWPHVVPTEPNYPYVANQAKLPGQRYPPYVTDAGKPPVTAEPWAGVLFNGHGRGIPLNYSSERCNGTSDSWGPPKGDYYVIRVTRGKTYRLRFVNLATNWGYRVWFPNHTVTIISISGGDVEPIKIHPQKHDKPFNQNGIEMNTGERYDLLFTADYHGDVQMLRVDSLDGCYKDLAFILYNDANLTAPLIETADAIKRNRTCDQDCYVNDACDLYKQFASDLNLTQIKSINPQGKPPPNPDNNLLNFSITRPGRGVPFPPGYNSTKPGTFFINNVKTPLFNPYIYLQQYEAKGISNTKQDPGFLARYSRGQGQIVDWYMMLPMQ